MKNKLILLVFTLMAMTVQATDLYWVGGTGNWSDPAHWSLSSGGEQYGFLPTAEDNVLFDANSFLTTGNTITVDILNTSINNMTWTGVANTPTFVMSAGKTMEVSGSITLAEAMVFNNVGHIKLTSTSSSNTLTTLGQDVGTITFDGVDGVWDLSDDFKCAAMNLLNGTFNSNDYTIDQTSAWPGVYQGSGSGVSSGIFSSNSNIRTLNLGASTLNLSAWVGSPFNLTDATNLTFIGDQTTINVTGNNNNGTQTFHGGGQDFGTLTFSIGKVVGGNGWVITGDNSFSNLSFPQNGYLNGSNTITNLSLSAGGTYKFKSDATQVITNYDQTGTGSCLAPIALISDASTVSTLSITAPADIVLAYATLQNIAVTGGATFTATNSVDLGGNTGWTSIGSLEATNHDLYWIGGTGNWSDPAHWSLSSGGEQYGFLPTAEDNVLFDANSFLTTGNTITVDILNTSINNMTWTGVANTPTFVMSAGKTMEVSGSITLAEAMVFNNVGHIKLTSTSSSNTLTTLGQDVGTITFDGVDGVWDLSDDFKCAAMNLLNGTFNSNDYTIDQTSAWPGVYQGSGSGVSSGIFSSNSNIRTLNLGASTLNLSAWVGSPFNLTDATNLTFIGDQTTINVTGNNNNGTQTFHGGGQDFGTLTFSIGKVVGGNGWVITGDNSFSNLSFPQNGYLNGSNTITNLSLSAGGIYKFKSDATQVINGSIDASGTTNAQLTIKSDNTAQAILVGAGTYCMDYLTIEYMKTSGGGIFNAGINSNDAVGNDGFIFTDTCDPIIVVSDTVVPVITLTGDAVVTIEVDATYTDAGASALDNIDGDLTTSIVETGTVDASTVSVYTLSYNVTDAAGNAAMEVTRTVNVVDTTVPVITLEGETTVTLEVGTSYTDAGATASDNYDGDITDTIVIVNNVDSAVVGTYAVTYNVSDANGNAAEEVTRTVIIESSLSTEDNTMNIIKVYPNPVKDKLFISGNETPITVAIYNVLGKEVLSIKNTNNINVQALPSGVYMIRISDGVGQTNRKFIKN